uniref:Uncharacterized protein n=1 Tax=Spongospora subterranea TaxID=70186 RepID=A0A0H5R170_9EUKA|eukprot:CRZ01542.1 hypothetical protein [Spongospora subterranea]
MSAAVYCESPFWVAYVELIAYDIRACNRQNLPRYVEQIDRMIGFVIPDNSICQRPRNRIELGWKTMLSLDQSSIINHVEPIAYDESGTSIDPRICVNPSRFAWHGQ